MKKAFLTQLPLALLLALGTTHATLADNGRHLGDHSPGRSEARAYVQANVLPVVRQQRQKLEAQLTPADQTQLAAYRAQLKALRTQEQALRQQLQPADPAAEGRPALTDAQRQQLHDLRRQTGAILLSVGQMARKYEANLAQLAQEIAPQQTKWLADLQAIATKNAPADQPDAPAWPAGASNPRPAGPGHHGPDGPGLRGGIGHHGPMGRYFQPVAFLLLASDSPVAAPVMLGGTSLYPNPAAAATRLQYDVQTAGAVTIDLLDAQGTRLRTLVQPLQRDRGTYTETLDFGDLPGGTYYYKITTSSGTETKRFLKE